MITIQQLFDDLAYGELSGLAMGNSVMGSITEAQYPKIISAINIGLIDLYKRFPLKEKELKLHQQSGLFTYYLRKAFVGTVGKMSLLAYLEEDANDPFEDDVLKVIDAYDETDVRLPLNNGAYRSTGVFTPVHDTIKMFPSDPPKVISLIYRARYPEIILTDDFVPEDYFLYIPDSIREALLLFIASRVFTSKASRNAEGEPNVAMSFLYHYENVCKRLQDDDVFANVTDTHSSFESKGWC